MKLSTMLLLVAALAQVGAALPAAFAKEAAASTYLLRYKFGLGEVLRYRVQHATNLRTTMEKETQRMTSQTDSVKVWKVTDVLPSGDMEFIHLVESVRMSNEGSSQPKRSFDSTSGDPPAPGFEAAARAVGVPLLLVRIAPDGRVLSREQKLAQQEPAAEDMPITLELPENAVAVGDKWSHSYNISVPRDKGAPLALRTRRLCRLRQVTNGVAVIDVEYQILTPVDASIRAKIIEKLTKGTVRFDIERGRVIQQTHEVDRREVGFVESTKASSLHFVARTHEQLLNVKRADLARVQAASAEE